MSSDQEISSSSNDEQEDGVYIVEEVLDRRIVNDKVEYYLKWKGYSYEESTWEPEENVTCDKLIADFEERKKKEKLLESSNRSQPYPSTYSDSTISLSSLSLSPGTSQNKTAINNNRIHDDGKGKSKDDDHIKHKHCNKTNSKKENVELHPGTSKSNQEHKVRGFQRGLEVEKILGATNAGGELLFLIKWKGSDEADLVEAKQANIRIPQTVIKFYEERLQWTSDS
ncbi:chromobox protein homolog 5-like isoform X2 [Lycorma delicatula]